MTVTSRSNQYAKPSLDGGSPPIAPRDCRRHFTIPVAHNTPKVDPDLKDFLAGTSKIEFQPEDPDMQDFLVATSNPQANLDHSHDPDLQDFLVATSVPEQHPVDAEISQPSNKGSSLGRFFVRIPPFCCSVILLTDV